MNFTRFKVFTRKSIVGFRILKNHKSFRYCCSSSKSELPPYKVLFFGSGQVGLTTFQRLHERKDAVSSLELICPTPHTESNIKYEIETLKYAKKNAIPFQFYVSKKHNPNFDYTPIVSAAQKSDLGVIVDFGYLITREILDAFPNPPILMHPSLLPKYRGACPIERSIMYGEKEGGVTILGLDPFHFDCGKILLQKPYTIDLDKSGVEIKYDLAKLGADAVIDSLLSYKSIWTQAKPQELLTNYPKAPKIKAIDYFADWNEDDSEMVYNKWNALGCIRTYIVGCKYFRKSESNEPTLISLRKLVKMSSVIFKPLDLDNNQSASPGSLKWDKRNKLLWVKCKDGWIGISRILISGSKEINAADFVNGTKLHKDPAQSFQFIREKIGKNL